MSFLCVLIYKVIVPIHLKAVKGRGRTSKCLIRAKQIIQKFRRKNDLSRVPNSCMWSRSLLEQDKGCLLCLVKCSSLQEHCCSERVQEVSDRSLQLMSAR